MTIELKLLAELFGLAAVLGGFVFWLHKIVARFEKLEVQAARRRTDSEIMLKGLYACLDGLHQQGANGHVTKTREELNDYILQNS